MIIEECRNVELETELPSTGLNNELLLHNHVVEVRAKAGYCTSTFSGTTQRPSNFKLIQSVFRQLGISGVSVISRHILFDFLNCHLKQIQLETDYAWRRQLHVILYRHILRSKSITSFVFAKRRPFFHYVDDEYFRSCLERLLNS